MQVGKSRPTSMANEEFEFDAALLRITDLISKHRSSLRDKSLPVTANLTNTPELISLPDKGLGTRSTLDHLETSILPNLAQGHAGPRYYGFNNTKLKSNTCRIRHRGHHSVCVISRLSRFSIRPECSSAFASID
jgi:hypothetical protein